MFTSPRGVAGHYDGTREPLVRVPRLYHSVTLLTLVSLLFGSILLWQPQGAAAATASEAVTTDYLNLRSAPNLSASVLTVMPAGMGVTVTGSEQSGFYPVAYGTMSGFASTQYLSIGGGASTIETGGATGNATVIDGALNLRSGPGVTYSVLTVMPDAARVTLTGESSNGFLGVTFNGASGYAYAAYLNAGGESRTGDSTDTRAEKTPTATAEAASDASSGPTSPVSVGDTVVDSAVTQTSLNLRQGPSSSYTVQVVMPAGARVDIMGGAQGGFYPVSFNGTKGWASGDYLSIGSTAASAPAATTPQTPVAAAAPADTSGGDIVSIIYAAADAYGQPREDMLRVAECESNLDPYEVHPTSGASGLFQFLPGTWATTPYAGQDIFDPVANANAAAWMWSVGRRNEWVCQ